MRRAGVGDDWRATEHCRRVRRGGEHATTSVARGVVGARRRQREIVHTARVSWCVGVRVWRLTPLNDSEKMKQLLELPDKSLEFTSHSCEFVTKPGLLCVCVWRAHSVFRVASKRTNSRSGAVVML
jgi:hypothetical protein